VTDHFDKEVGLSCEYLHLEIPVDVVNRIEFVHYRSKTLVFLVETNSVNQQFVIIEERRSDLHRE